MTSRRLRVLVLYAASEENETLAYQKAWPRALARHAAFECTSLNIVERSGAAVARELLRRPRRLDAIVMLHSVFSNARLLHGLAARAVALSRLPKAYFLGNEYKLMREKMAFCEELGVTLLVSLLSSPEAHEMYRKRLECAVVGIPSAGLDTNLFRPERDRASRPIDLGYRAYESPLHLGHAERREIATAFRSPAVERGFVTDISLDHHDRLTESAWAAYLNDCKGQLGTEAGGDYFEIDDRTRDAVFAFLSDHPDADIAEIRERFFRDYPNPVSGRALSGRVVEAAGTKTVQLLLEGEYGGYFSPDEHYIPVMKDFSNVGEALDKLADESLCRSLTDAAYAVALEHLTYERLIDRLHDALAALVV